MMRTPLVALLVISLVCNTFGFYVFERRGVCTAMMNCKNAVSHVSSNDEKCSAWADSSCVKYRRQRRKGLDCDDRVMDPLDNTLNSYAFFCRGGSNWG